MAVVSRSNVPTAHPDATEHRRLLAVAINQALLGRLNNTGLVTLEVDESDTTVIDRKVAIGSVILLTPLTAAAAAEVASGNLYIAAVTAEQFTIAHTNSATTGRDFAYAVLG